jgi:hypothetical protein
MGILLKYWDVMVWVPFDETTGGKRGNALTVKVNAIASLSVLLKFTSREPPFQEISPLV